MNTEVSLPVTAPLPAGPAVAAAPVGAAPAAFPWLRVGIVLLAAVLRLWDLDLRPPHFDEGVNGWFTDQMQHLGCYQYDPHNYHGPLHFYVLFLFVKVLFGRHLWALRLPVVIVGVLTIDLVFRFERFLGRRTCAWAALAMTLSPGFLYYQRDAIHETWLAYFLVLGFWGLFGLWQEGGKRYLWAVGMALAGAVLTKETYLIHVGCLALAVPCLLVVESLAPSVRTIFARPGDGGEPPEEDRSALTPLFDEVPPWSGPVWRSFAPQAWRENDAWTVTVVGLALILFFYSGNGFYLFQDAPVDGHTVHQLTAPGIRGLFSAFKFWGQKSQEGEGHNKPFLYWTRLLINNEPWAIFGVLASFFYAVPALRTFRGRARVPGVALLVVSAGAFVFLTELYSQFEDVPGAEGVYHFVRFHPLSPAVYLALWTASLLGFALGVACLELPAPGDWRLRLLAIYGLGNLVAYSLIPYKTPWCAISFAWPFLFVGGAAVADLGAYVVRAGAGGTEPRAALLHRLIPLTAGLALAYSAFLAVRLNYYRPTAEKGEDYVYVQTFPDMWKITDPMLRLARRDPRAYHLKGVILCGSTYPLPWVLGDFTGIGYYSDEAQPAEYRADFLLVQESRVPEVESRLDTDYFKQEVHLRSAQGALMLYFRAARFAREFPGRQPELHRQKPPAPPRVKRGPPTQTVRILTQPRTR